MQARTDYARNVRTGIPASLAQVRVTLAGTATDATLYSDNLSPPTPKVNPFTADALTGIYTYYVANGLYDETVTPVGLDPLLYAYTTPSLLFGDPTGYGVVNVKDFGAVGDGLTDDTAAIQAALDSAPAIGKAVFFPTGTYRTTSALTVKSYTRLFGTSTGGSTAGSFVLAALFGAVIKNEGVGVALHLVDLTSSANKTTQQITIEDLTIVGNGATSSHGVLIDNPAMVQILRCFIANHGGVGPSLVGVGLGLKDDLPGRNRGVRDCALALG